MFIADTLNNVIREVRPDGIITTVAGNGTAGYSGDGGPATDASSIIPTDVAVDSAGDLFIADSNNNVIREVRPDGIITTVAGNGTAGYSGDGGPATSATLSNPTGVAVDGAGDLFIADSSNGVVREVAPNGIISTFVGAGNYHANLPGRRRARRLVLYRRLERLALGADVRWYDQQGRRAAGRAQRRGGRQCGRRVRGRQLRQSGP